MATLLWHGRAHTTRGTDRVKLAIYHPWVYLTSGIERSFVELLRRSRHDWTIFTHHHDPDTTYPQLRGADVRLLDPPVSVRRSFVPIAQAAATIGRTRLPLDGHGALLVSSEGLGDLIVARNDVPAAVYCHTPLKILHDPANRAALLARRPELRWPLATLGRAFSSVDRRMWRRFQHRLANSHETRHRIVTAGLATVDEVEVLHPGVDTTTFHEGPSEREPVLLVPGRIMWQKNVELAIEAFARARHAGLRARLVIAGAVDDKSQPYLGELRAVAAGLPVEFVVDPSDATLVDLYRRALAVVFTARNEDFGIVPLEAMACGTPVVAVDAGGVRETVVDGVTGWLEPDDAGRFADRMLQIEAAGRRLRPMRRAARAWADGFSWDAFARRIDELMEALAGDEPRLIELPDDVRTGMPTP